MRNPGAIFWEQSSSLEIKPEMTAESSKDVAERLVAFSSVTILTSFLGSKSGTMTRPTAAASFEGLRAQSGIWILKFSALKKAAAVMRRRWEESEEENWRGRGNLFGADQKGAPMLVAESSGKVNVNCFTRLEK